MKKLLMLSIITLLTSCARDMSSSSYVDSATSGIVLEGVIVSSRPVTIKGSDKLGDNTVGLLGGGVAGGVLGSTIGRGTGSVVGAVGGAAAGALLGSVVQQQLSESDGFEYIVKVNRDNTPASNTKTELISVVQAKDVIYTNGQHVYVIYADDRPRLLARQ